MIQNKYWDIQALGNIWENVFKLFILQIMLILYFLLVIQRTIVFLCLLHKMLLHLSANCSVVFFFMRKIGGDWTEDLFRSWLGLHMLECSHCNLFFWFLTCISNIAYSTNYDKNERWLEMPVKLWNILWFSI